MGKGAILSQSSAYALLAVLLCASSSLCDKEVTHPAVYYKEDYVSADYDPTSANATSRELKPNSLLKSEKLVFDYLPNTNTEQRESKRHGRHHKRIHNRDEFLKRSKRQATFNDPHGVFSEQQQHKSKTSSNQVSSRQRRQYFQQQPYQPYNTYNSWGASSSYGGYYVTPNVVSFIPAAFNLPSNYYLPVASNNNNNNNNHNAKIPIRGIYYNPISVPGNFAAVRPNPPSVTVGNRIGDEPDYFDERPVWEVRYENTRPPSASVTTRRPTTVSTPPPLLHGRDRTSTPPPLLHGRDNNAVTQRPPATFTTRRPQVIPQATTRRPTSPQELSKCVWAIVSCCSRDNPTVRYQCFEQMGCMGAFWGLNPCANDIQDDALDAADRFFD